MSLQIRGRSFDKVGGLDHHIQTLKEMIIYPLLYKELFESHGIEAPRGVLFHGPPGTGKTLVAGAVAAECSKSTSRRVAFYMRKGSDCLNKYVGESEKHLQNLFTQAQNTRPSIIFFDEIDGLVPTRSESQEQVHASVVSTLLALMDGLDSKSEVFVIGATNRIDMIDPALRRPGRFDRELYFPLPPLESRYQIFCIHTKNWKFKPNPDFLLKFASECVGYCGADIQSLCSQAVMESFRRNFPQVSDTTRKIHVNLRNVQVKTEDFWAAKEKLVPASQRVFTVPSRPLTPDLEPLLKRSLDVCLDFILKSCPFKFIHRNKPEFAKNKSITCPRVLLARNGDKGHIPYLASAVLHNFDHLPVTVIDLTTINDQPVRCSDSSSLVQKFKQAKQSMPGIIYFPDIGSCWDLFDETGKMVLMSSLEKLDSNSSIQLLLLATSNSFDYDDLPSDIRKLFPKNKALQVSGPVHEERFKFFAKLFRKYLHQQHPTTEKLETKESNIEAQRRSRRQKGLEAEYLGISFVSRPKPGSYYQKHLDQKPIIIRNRNLTPTSVKRPFETNRRPMKRLKTENSKPEMESECSKEPRSSLEENGEIDDSKVKDLAELCVQATLNGHTESVVKLYEQLEIILLRFKSTWEKSHLLEILHLDKLEDLLAKYRIKFHYAEIDNQQPHVAATSKQ